MCDYLLPFCSELPDFRSMLQNAEVEGEVFTMPAVMAYEESIGRLIDGLIVDFDTRWMFVLRFAIRGRIFPMARALHAQ